jgi:Protein of unknown function (DUF1639)
MSATISFGDNLSPCPSPANPSPENKMETTMKRSRRYNFSLPTFSWGTQRVIPWVKDPSFSSEATLPPLPLPKPSLEKDKEKSGVVEIPWKLRKRRSDTSSPVDNGSVAGLVAPVVVAKKEKEKEKVKEKRKTKLSIPLSSMEIRDDFLLMKGKKPASRPKKRPRHVQKLIDVMQFFFFISPT